MKIELLKIAIKKNEYEDIKLTKSDIERLYRIFEDFLEEKDYKSGEEILNIFLSKKIEQLFELYQISEFYKSKEWNEIVDTLNKVFKNHMIKLIKKDDFASFKRLLNHKKYWGDYPCGGVSNQFDWAEIKKNIIHKAWNIQRTQNINLQSFEELHVVLFRNKRNNWIIHLIKQHFQANKILDIIKESLAKSNDKFLDKALRIYIDKIFDFEMLRFIGWGSEDGGLEKLCKILIEKKKNKLLNEFIDRLSDEIKMHKDRLVSIYGYTSGHLDELIIFIGKNDYKFLKEKVKEYFSQPRNISYFGTYLLIECIRKDDTDNVRFILGRTRINFKDLDSYLKKFFIKTLIIANSVDIDNCPSGIIKDLKVFDKRKKRDISPKYDVYSFIDYTYKDSIDNIYQKLLLLIKKLLEKKEKSVDNLLFYSDFVINSLSRNISNLDHGKYFGYLLKVITGTDKAENAIEQIQKVLAVPYEAEYQYMTHITTTRNLNYDKARLIQTIQIFMLNCIYRKVYFGSLETLQGNVIAYILNYLKIFKRGLRNIPFIKEGQKISNEEILEMLFTIQFSHNVILEKKRGRNYYDTIISELIIALMKYYKEKITEEKIKMQVEHEKKIIVKEAEAEIRAQKEAKEKIEKIIQQYSHTLANTLFPNAIYEVANKLKTHIEFKKDARILTDAYHAEMLIKRQGQLLQARNTGNDKNFQMLIRQDRLDNDKDKNFVTVEEILNDAIERVLARFLNQDYHKIDKIRKEICRRRNTTLDKLKNSFERDVFYSEKEKPIDWANKNIAAIKVSFTNLWKQIKLKKDNYAQALLQGYFGELLFNAMKYRDYDKDIWIDIDFNEVEIDGEIYLKSIWSNPFMLDKNISISTGKGIESIKNDLEMLNETKDKNRTAIVNIENKIFYVELSFIKDLLILTPMKKLNTEKLLKNQKNKQK